MKDSFSYQNQEYWGKKKKQFGKVDKLVKNSGCSKQEKVNTQTKRACAKIHPNIYKHRANIKKRICTFASLYNSRVTSYMKSLNF